MSTQSEEDFEVVQEEQLTLYVTQTNLSTLPIVDQINQYLVIYYKDQEFESSTQYESGANAQFVQSSFDLGKGDHHELLLEVWTRDSDFNGIK